MSNLRSREKAREAAVLSCFSRSGLCDPARLPCTWDLSGKNTGMGCHFLLLGISPTQGSNLSLMSPASAGRFFTTSATWEARDTDDRVHTFPPPRLGDLETLLKYLVREPMFTRVSYDLGDFKA